MLGSCFPPLRKDADVCGRFACPLRADPLPSPTMVLLVDGMLGLPDDVLNYVVHRILASSLATARSLCCVCSAACRLVLPVLSAIQPVDQNCLEAARAYYLVSKRWWDAWAGGDLSPGPIGNQDIVETFSTCNHAMAQLKASVLSSSVVALTPLSWQLLQEVCGGGPAAMRIARLRPASSIAVLELHHLALRVHLLIGDMPRAAETKEPLILPVGHYALVSETWREACEAWTSRLKPSRPSSPIRAPPEDAIANALAAISAGHARLWDYHRRCRIALLDPDYLDAVYGEPDPCLQRCRIYHGQQLLLEVPRSDGTWCTSRSPDAA